MCACGLRQRMALYASFTQATQGPKHASNLTQAIARDKFQACHNWPLVACVALLALCALHCLRKAGNRT